MAIEKKWPAIAPRALTADGTTLGVIILSNTRDFRVKMTIVIQSSTKPPLQLQVNRVLPTMLIVGPAPTKNQPSKITDRANVSAYLVADNAFVFASEQDKAMLKPDDAEQATYEQEPVVARRSISVDEYGNFYNETNPIPVVSVGDQVWDDLIISRDPTTQDITKVEYKKNDQVIRTLDMTYDDNENLVEVKKS